MHFLIDGRALQMGIRSGIPRLTSATIEALASIGNEHRFSVITTGAREVVLKLPANMRQVHFQIPNKLLHASLFLTGQPLLDKLVEHKTGETVDSVFLPNLHFFSSRAPYALLVHDLSFLVSPELFSRYDSFVHRCKRPLRLLQEASGLLAVSQATARDITAFTGRTEITVVDPSSAATNVRHSRDRGNPEDTWIPNRVGDNKRFVLILGTTEPRKNLETAIRGFREWKNRDARAAPFKLVIAGAITAHGRELQKRYPNTFVAWLGQVADRERSELIASAWALLYPSRYEGFGLPLIEAQRAGIPIITSHVTSLPEVVGSSALLIDPERPETIAVALQALMNEAIRINYGRPSATKTYGLPLGEAILSILLNIARKRS